MSSVAYPHIVTDERGVLRVEGTPYKAIVLLQLVNGQRWGASDLVENYPDITLAQAHALLGYYYDNKAELDEVMGKREERAAELRKSIPDPPSLERFRKIKANGGVQPPP